MIFTTESGTTFEVRNTPFMTQEIRESPDFLAIGPLPVENTFRPFTFTKAPHIGKSVEVSFGIDADNIETFWTTDPVIHITF
jgi:hypothetical protein